jgi:hypothetical protein
MNAYNHFFAAAIIAIGFIIGGACQANTIAVGEADFEGAPGRGTVSLAPWRKSVNGGNVIGIESYATLAAVVDSVPNGGLYCHYINSINESIYQVLSTNLMADTTYTLSIVAIDRSDQVFQPSDLRMGYVPTTDDGSTGDMIANDFYGEYLLAGMTLTNTIPVNGAAADDGYMTWVSEFKVRFGDPGVGNPIRIEIVGSGVQSLFDNVSLIFEKSPRGTLITLR